MRTDTPPAIWSKKSHFFWRNLFFFSWLHFGNNTYQDSIFASFHLPFIYLCMYVYNILKSLFFWDVLDILHSFTAKFPPKMLIFPHKPQSYLHFLPIPTSTKVASSWCTLWVISQLSVSRRSNPFFHMAARAEESRERRREHLLCCSRHMERGGKLLRLSFTLRLLVTH